MVLIPERAEFDIFVGSRIGSFKHIKYHTDESKNSKKCIENLQEISALQKGEAVTCLRWSDPEQKVALIGRASRVVQVYDTEVGAFTSSVVAEHGNGSVVGVSKVNGKLLTALSGGAVRLWTKKPTDFDTGGELDQMRVCPEEPELIATGGKENDLKVWHLHTQAPIFSAKNVRHDQLELRVPVWATDVCFLPGGGAMLATCSRYGTVRLYDTRAQRRPVCEVPFTNMAATCIAPAFHERQVLVGFGRGQLHIVDLRGRGHPDKDFKGSVGAITDVSTVPGTPYIVSVGLDRHLKIHHVGTRKIIYKQYLTSKLSALLVQTERSTPLTKVKVEPKEEPETVMEEVEVQADDLDDLFQDMETISEKPTTKKRKPDQYKTKKKKKRALEDNSDAKTQEEKSEVEAEVIESNSEDDTEAGIAKLLKLTEKKKRKLQKLRKKKKEKSVFHNA